MADENPFAPSRMDVSLLDADDQQARRSFALSVAILLVPAALNYALWDREFLSSYYAADLVILLRVLNISGLLLLFLAIWCFTLPVFNLGFRFLLPGAEPLRKRWRDIWHGALMRLPAFAVGGALLWFAWLCLFFWLEIPDFEFSILWQILAHILAARWYLPILFQFGGIWRDHFRQKKATAN